MDGEAKPQSVQRFGQIAQLSATLLLPKKLLTELELIRHIAWWMFTLTRLAKEDLRATATFENHSAKLIYLCACGFHCTIGLHSFYFGLYNIAEKELCLNMN